MSRRARMGGLLLALVVWLGAGGAAATGEGRPVCTYIPPLRYPPALAAEQPHLAGTVLVRVDVDAQGRVAGATMLRSELPELFIVEALRAARASSFRPAPGQQPSERSSLVMLLHFKGDAAPPAERALAPAQPVPGLAAPVTPAAPAPTPPPSETPAAAPVSPGKGKLRVLDAGFGRGVENRRLLERDEVFGEGDKVYFWMEVDGAHVGEVLRHIWIYRGREMQEIELTLKAERWATWSYKTFFPDQRGAWLLELRDAEDHLLGSWSCYCE